MSATDRENADAFRRRRTGLPAGQVFSVKPWGNEPTPFYVLVVRPTWSGALCGGTARRVLPVVRAEVSVPRSTRRSTAGGPEDILVLVILTLHGTAEKSTANLLGPARSSTR